MALGKIAKDEELFTTYAEPFVEYADRHLSILRVWGFDCRCELCLLDEKDDHQTRRQLQYDKAREMAKSQGVREMLLLKIKIEGTYATGRALRPALALILRDLMEVTSLPNKLRFQVSILSTL